MSVRSVALVGLAALALPSAALAIPLDCDGSTANKLNVSVTGVKSSSGRVTVTLYLNEPKRFLSKGGAYGIARAPAQAGTTQVCIAIPGPGKYALAVYHDVDGDGRLDRNVIGLPSEPFALSNNPPPRMAVPKIGPSLFTAGAGETSVTVRLQRAPKDKKKVALGEAAAVAS
jgi:uncharacterized protein (DUF2141 family)